MRTCEWVGGVDQLGRSDSGQRSSIWAAFAVWATEAPHDLQSKTSRSSWNARQIVRTGAMGCRHAGQQVELKAYEVLRDMPHKYRNKPPTH